jgi:hypothetical protein
MQLMPETDNHSRANVTAQQLLAVLASQCLPLLHTARSRNGSWTFETVSSNEGDALALHVHVPRDSINPSKLPPSKLLQNLDLSGSLNVRTIRHTGCRRNGSCAYQ